MRELPAAGRLAAWGTAVLLGAESPDAAADAVGGPSDPTHRVHGLPGEAADVSLPYALARLRALGAVGLRLVLPRPGDPGVLPGPAAFSTAAVEAGAAALTDGRCHLGLLPAGRAAWQVWEVGADPRTPLALREAELALGAAVREAAEALARLDVGRWDPAAAEVLDRGRTSAPDLPRSAGGAAQRVLAQALRISAVAEVALAGAGGAVTGAEADERARELRRLDVAARRAVEAACSTPVIG